MIYYYSYYYRWIERCIDDATVDVMDLSVISIFTRSKWQQLYVVVIDSSIYEILFQAEHQVFFNGFFKKY